MSESPRTRANKIVRGLHESIEYQRSIVGLCDRVLAFRSLSFAHGLARWARGNAESEIDTLRSLSAAMRIAVMNTRDTSS
jgi:hypothetical protein